MEDLGRYNPAGSDLRRMQLKMAEILDVVVEIFERNGIPYWLDGGTMLGAVRHGGFIPWDDDIDIDVPARYYRKAKKVLEKELPADLFLQTRGGGYKERWMKVKDRYSIVDEPSSEGLEQRGIFVDIFKVRRIGRHEHAVKKGIDRRIAKYRKKGNVFMRRLMKIFYHLTTPLFIFEKKTLFYTDDMFVKWAFPLSLTEPLGKVAFEGKEYAAPNDPDLYLRIHYGDYMAIPEENDRIFHASKVIFLERE